MQILSNNTNYNYFVKTNMYDSPSVYSYKKKQVLNKNLVRELQAKTNDNLFLNIQSYDNKSCYYTTFKGSDNIGNSQKLIKKFIKIKQLKQSSLLADFYQSNIDYLSNKINNNEYIDKVFDFITKYRNEKMINNKLEKFNDAEDKFITDIRLTADFDKLSYLNDVTLHHMLEKLIH